MISARFVLLASLTLSAVACKAGMSSMLIEIVANQPLEGRVNAFAVTATQGKNQSQTVMLAIPGDGVDVPTDGLSPPSFGLRFESSIRGDVTISVEARASNAVLGKGTGIAMDLAPGKTARPLRITLLKETMPLPTDGSTDALPKDGGLQDTLSSPDQAAPDLLKALPVCIFDDDMSTFDNCAFAP